MPERALQAHEMSTNIAIEPRRTLEVFQDLDLRGPVKDRSALREALLECVAAPWCHSEEKERALSTSAREYSDVLIFERAASDGLAAATIVLWSRPDGYEVTNIVPLDITELGRSQYNAILRDFEKQIATPAAGRVGFGVETTPPRQSIEEWASGSVVEALRRFSGAANKGTGSSHPLDQRRWFEFLIRAHEDS